MPLLVRPNGSPDTFEIVAGRRRYFAARTVKEERGDFPIPSTREGHTWQLVKGVALSTLLGVGTEIGFGDDEGDFIRALRESTQSNVNRAGQRIVGRNLDIQPTITVRQGWPLRVIVHKDLILRPYRGRR
ncbi:MAG: hypothetical protein K1X51_03965 [Rhodospirillaceae bacterium]|nr:hypothetical protein [Rhodospirillaceae bacterium]